MKSNFHWIDSADQQWSMADEEMVMDVEERTKRREQCGMEKTKIENRIRRPVMELVSELEKSFLLHSVVDKHMHHPLTLAYLVCLYAFASLFLLLLDSTFSS